MRKLPPHALSVLVDANCVEASLWAAAAINLAKSMSGPTCCRSAEAVVVEALGVSHVAVRVAGSMNTSGSPVADGASACGASSTAGVTSSSRAGGMISA